MYTTDFLGKSCHILAVLIAPKKGSPLFAVPWPVLRLRCLSWKVYQAAPEKAERHSHNHLASVESYFKWAHIFFEGNAKLTYWTLQGLGTSAHTTHFHVAWIIDGKLDSWKPRFEWLNQPVILLFRWHQVPKNLVLPPCLYFGCHICSWLSTEVGIRIKSVLEKRPRRRKMAVFCTVKLHTIYTGPGDGWIIPW